MEEITDSQRMLAKALVKFRGSVGTVKYDSRNPHFKNKFASLAAIHKEIDPVLAENGLVVLQFPTSTEVSAGCRTIIMHESGGSIEHSFTVPLSKKDPQGACAAISYARRYGISGALGLVTEEDDDGESSIDRRPKAKTATPATPKESKDALKKFASVITGFTTFIEDCKSRDELKDFWNTNKKEMGRFEEEQPEVFTAVMDSFKAKGKSFN